MRIGFLVWNEFQFYHFRSILKAMPEATLFVDVRAGLHRRFPFEILKEISNPVVKLRNSELSSIAGLVDGLVVQSNTDTRAQLPNIPLIATQYSLSKEWHQYGKWMKEADLVLCFGEYSRRKIQTDAPVIAIGNPRMDDYFNNMLDDAILDEMRRKLEPKKPTIMFAPSWNDQNMTAALNYSRRSLAKKFNVFWSPHHNTRIFGNKITSILFRRNVNYDRYLYCLKLSDILVSDTSGALFDALHAGKFAIIADFNDSASIEQDSIEFNMREKIGPVARAPEDIGRYANDLMIRAVDFRQVNAELSNLCFCGNGDAAERAADAIRTFLAQKLSRASAL